MSKPWSFFPEIDMGYELADIPLTKIETADRTFQISTDEVFTDLALSISAIGLLTPPLLIEKESSYTVICGFRRIAACRSLCIETIPARILSHDSPMAFAARVAISENALQRNLNIVEQSRAYDLILRCVGAEADIWEMAKSVGLPHNQAALERLRAVAAMPEFLQKAILDGTLAVPVAIELDLWDRKDAQIVEELFRQITPGLNVQRELLTLFLEISLRDDLCIAQLIGNREIASVLESDVTSAPQKVQAIRLLLKKVRYPELSRRETVYHQSLKSLKLNTHLQLTPPRFFESNTYRLTATITSRRQLKSLLPELNRLIDHPDLLPE